MLGKRAFLDISVWTGLIILAFILVMGWVKNFGSPRQVFYELARQCSKESADIRTRHLSKVETEHFVIKYDKRSQTQVSLVAEAAEEIYQPVVRIFGQEPKQPVLVIIYPDSWSLAKSFGWERNERAMGVYWAGTIRILNPEEWITDGDIRTTFIREGPMAHEFAHLLVDQVTAGNYPRWFTEGIAQYVEKKVTGFEFASPFRYNPQAARCIDFETLEAKFDQMDQGTAYWQSLMATEYIAERYGEESLFEILYYLGQGDGMAFAFEEATGLPFVDFSRDFYLDMENK